MIRFYRLLDARLFPALVWYATHRLHITALLLLGFFLMLGGAYPALELVGGNYTNIVSAVVASVVLLRQSEHHRSIHQRLDDIEAQTKKQPRTKKEAL